MSPWVCFCVKNHTRHANAYSYIVNRDLYILFFTKVLRLGYRFNPTHGYNFNCLKLNVMTIIIRTYPLSLECRPCISNLVRFWLTADLALPFTSSAKLANLASIDTSTWKKYFLNIVIFNIGTSVEKIAN